MFLNLSVSCPINFSFFICFVLLVSKLHASQFGRRLYFKQGNRNDGIQAGLRSQWCGPFCIILCFSYFSFFFLSFFGFSVWTLMQCCWIVPFVVKIKMTWYNCTPTFVISWRKIFLVEPLRPFLLRNGSRGKHRVFCFDLRRFSVMPYTYNLMSIQLIFFEILFY